MTENLDNNAEKAAAKPSIQFHYLKSNLFRVIHCDGVIGGPSPQGNALHLSCYSERAPIPALTVHELNAAGVIGEQSKVVRREGIVREVEVDLVMSLESAKALANWINHNIEMVEALQRGKSEEVKP